MRWKESGYKFISYPIIACVTYLGFAWLLFYGLPVLNLTGAKMFVRDDVTMYTSFTIPFTAVDTVILVGYFRIAGKLAPWFNRWMAGLPERLKDIRHTGNEGSNAWKSTYWNC